MYVISTKSCHPGESIPGDVIQYLKTFDVKNDDGRGTRGAASSAGPAAPPHAALCHTGAASPPCASTTAVAQGLSSQKTDVILMRLKQNAEVATSSNDEVCMTASATHLRTSQVCTCKLSQPYDTTIHGMHQHTPLFIGCALIRQSCMPPHSWHYRITLLAVTARPAQ